MLIKRIPEKSLACDNVRVNLEDLSQIPSVITEPEQSTSRKARLMVIPRRVLLSAAGAGNKARSKQTTV